MRKKCASILVLIFAIASLAGCGNSLENQVVGEWGYEGDMMFTFYDDGTCLIYNEYGSGTWSIVNDNQIKVTSNLDGETHAMTVDDIDSDSMTLSYEDGAYGDPVTLDRLD